MSLWRLQLSLTREAPTVHLPPCGAARPELPLAPSSRLPAPGGPGSTVPCALHTGHRGAGSRQLRGHSPHPHPSLAPHWPASAWACPAPSHWPVAVDKALLGGWPPGRDWAPRGPGRPARTGAEAGADTPPQTAFGSDPDQGQCPPHPHCQSWDGQQGPAGQRPSRGALSGSSARWRRRRAWRRGARAPARAAGAAVLERAGTGTAPRREPAPRTLRPWGHPPRPPPHWPRALPHSHPSLRPKALAGQAGFSPSDICQASCPGHGAGPGEG